MASRGSFRERAAHAALAAAAAISIVAVALICVFLFVNGVPAIAKIGLPDFLFGMTWRPGNDIYGIFPMVVGSVFVTAGAIVVGVPVGILCAIFLSRFANSRIASIMMPCIELLAGIPSVVFGFFGLVVVVPFIRYMHPGSGMSLLAASLILGLMILPTVITVARSSLDAVPKSYYEGSLALGATHERSVFRILVPAAASGIIAGVVLGVCRAIGETMAVVMVAGNQTVIPDSLFDGVRTMTANIVLEMGYAAGLHREALIATGVVLFVFVLILTLALNVIKKRGEVK